MSARCSSVRAELQCTKRWLHFGWHEHGGMKWSDQQWLGGPFGFVTKPWSFVQRLRGRV